MSIQSYFTLLKLDKNKTISNKKLMQLKIKRNEFNPSKNNLDKQNIESFICLNLLDDKLNTQWVNTKTKEIFLELFSVNFNSSFSTLIDTFNLNPYDIDKNQLIITLDLAKEFIRDLEYLNSGNYSTNFEKILDSTFISDLGKNNLEYLKFKYKKNVDDIEDNYTLNKRLLNLFNSYILIHESFEYTNTKVILLYQVY